jgi:exosortase D (VPLPA-CTERM-specific)
VFVSSIPLTILMNSIRIGVIAVMVDRWGIGMAEGFLHEFQGWSVFMLTTAILILETALLNRLSRSRRPWRQLFGVEFPAPAPRASPVRKRTVPLPFAIAAVLIAGLALTANLLPARSEVIPERQSLADFPLGIDAWHGRRDVLESIYLDTLKLDDYLLADYVRPGADAVNLYVAYYQSQRKGEAVHSPRTCIPGGGWQLQEFGQTTVDDVTINGQPLRVNRTVIALGDRRAIVYYWFQQRGRIVTNEYAVKWFIFWDALTRNRTDGALVRLTLGLRDGADVSSVDTELREFARAIVPQLAHRIPD